MDTELIRSHILQAFFTPSPSIGLKVETVIDLRQSSPFSGKPCRYESIGDKQIRVDVEPVRVTECLSYKTSKVPLLASAFTDTAWRRAIKTSPRIYRVWINYCYNNDIIWDDQVLICNSIWGEFVELSRGLISRKKTEARLKTLIWLCVQNAKHLIFTDDALFKAIELSRLMNVHHSVWLRILKPHWQRMTDLCLELDSEALEYVHRNFESNRRPSKGLHVKEAQV